MMTTHQIPSYRDGITTTRRIDGEPSHTGRRTTPVTIGAFTPPHDAGWYEIRVQGRLHPRWSAWLDGVHLTPDRDGTTVLLGHVIDQAALHGLLARLRDIFRAFVWV